VLFATLMSVCLVVLLCLRLSGLMGDNAAQLRVQEKMQRLSEALSHQAKHDPLTGLGNRLLFAEQVDLMLDRRSGDGDRAPGLLLLDLDDFKLVNDSFGHEAGDRVLTEISRRLQRVTTHNEWPFRLGGDEFAIVQASARPDEAMSLAHRVNEALSEPFDLGPRQIRQRASIGISIALQGQTRSTLLAEADLAMYAGKTRGRGEPGMFDVALYRNTLDRHELERDLLDAVARHEMRLVYQPLVSLASQSMVGVEALLRWEHPTRGTVGPQEFIPLAEVNGAILDLGEWVLREALQQLLAWDELVADRPLRMSVNVSPRELANPGFVDQVASVLLLAGIAPARVTLEITEAAFGADAEAMIERLHALKALGLILAIDDFGTEYSSLSRLRSIPFDVLKIDKSFVDHIASVPAERAVTATIVSLATSLGKTAVAEGVETEAQLAELLRLDVAYGQGYLFAKPVGAHAITELLSLTLEGASQLP
jgi:diguanylate cyclase (GGDEF)-like protein